MAIFALRVGLDMVFGFSGSDFFVVAGKATINDWRVIDVDFCPGDLIVALAALGIRARMGGWLALGHIVVVTAGATGWYALEYAADMANLTCYVLMCTMQREVCLAMVEVLVNFSETIGCLGKG